MHRLTPPGLVLMLLAVFCAPVILFAVPPAERAYRVTLQPGEALDGPRAVAEQMAATYGGTLGEAGALAGDGFVVRLSEPRARVLSADPRVKSVVPMGPGTAAASAVVEAVAWSSGVSYSYDGAGNVKQVGSDRFAYDDVNRLVQATVNGVTRKYEYDAFGNRMGCTQFGQNDCQAFTINTVENKNRIAQASYDAAGNVVVQSNHAYSYDALNMMTRDTYGQLARELVYTADDERIATYTVGSSWRWTVRDTSGKVLREFSSADTPGGLGTANWKWEKDYVWRDGLLLASRQPDGAVTTTYHYHLDHLGTPRRITDNSDQIVGVHDYFAFGPQASTQVQESSLTSLKYTGHERDGWSSESSDTLDYMHARYYSPWLGRFLSVDPVIDVKKALVTPQMWNRYAYVLNNPMVFIDPTGMTVYLVTYTVGNDQGDDEFRRAAVQRALELQHQKGYDATKDAVLVRGVQTKADFQAAVKEANGMFKQYGRVGEVSMFSHAGKRDGPVFEHGTRRTSQFTEPELGRIAVNWADNAHACFFGCNTGVRFANLFSSAQGVTTYGFLGYASFSANPDHYERITQTGPVYMMTVPPHQLRSLGLTTPWPMVHEDP